MHHISRKVHSGQPALREAGPSERADTETAPDGEMAQDPGLPRYLQRSSGHASGQEAQDDDRDEDAEAETPAEILQPKLQIGPPDDPLEREADAVAEATIQRKCDTCGAQTRGADEEEAPCPNCAGGNAVHVQTKTDSAATPKPTQAVAEALAHPAGGAPLEDSIRGQTEGVLGHDLSGVRVHEGARADGAARSIGARAFTHGPDIWLARGESARDTALMAHEATHTVQQAQGTAAPQLVQRHDAPDLDRTEHLRTHLENDEERAAIDVMGRMSEAEARAVLRDGSMRALATSAFWNYEMNEALLDLPGDLWWSLFWAFDEGTNWEGAKGLLESKSEFIPNSVLSSTYMRDQFVGICDNDTMLEAVELLGGPLPDRLRWLEAEGNGWSDVKTLLEGEDPDTRNALYDLDDIRDYFVSICGDHQMREAVRLLGGPLVKQLLWLKAEDAHFRYFRYVIAAAPEGEKVAVYESTELRNYFRGALGDLYMRQLVNYLGGPLSNQMEWLRGEDSDYAPREAEEMPGRATRDEALMSRLEGAHHLYSANRQYETAREEYHAVRDTPSYGGGDKPSASEIRQRMDSLDSTRAAMNRAEEARDAELQDSPYSTMSEFEAEQERFVAFFQGYALQTAHQMLRENHRLAESEQQRYDPSGQGTSGIWAALEPAREKWREANEAASEAREQYRRHANMGKYTTHWDSDAAEAEHARMAAAASARTQEARALVHGQAPTYPILAEQDLTEGIRLRRLMEADEAALGGLLNSAAQETLDNIEQVQDDLRDDTGKIWKMQPVITNAKQQLGIQQGSVFDSIIGDAIAEAGSGGIWANLALAALAIGLGLISGGVGAAAIAGAVGVSTGVVTGTAAVGGLIVSAYTVSESYENYSHGMAAANTSFDQARSVAASEPSMLWLAIDIVGLGLDLGGAIKAFRALAAPARAAAAAEDATDAVRLLEDVRAAARRSAAEAGANADELAEAAVASALRQQERAGVLRSAEGTRAAGEIAQAAGVSADEIGDVATAGLARLDPNLRGAALDALRGRPALIQEFGAFAEANRGFIGSLDNLRTALPEGQFGPLLSDLMLRRDNNQLLMLLDGLRSGDVGPDDLAAIRTAMSRAESAGGRTRAFQDQLATLLSRNADEAAEAVQDGVRTMDDWLARLNPETRARIEGNPDLHRFYSEMDPRTRRMLTFCASPCVALSPPPTPSQVRAIEAVHARLGLANDHPGFRLLIHGRSGDAMDTAIAALDELAAARAAGTISDELMEEVLGSPGLRRVLTEYEGAADDLAGLWTDWTARQADLASTNFTQYVGRRGFSTGIAARRPPIALANVVGTAAGQPNALRNVALLRRTVGTDSLAPRLADAIENGAFPDHLMQRIRRVMDQDFIGTSTFADGPRSRLVREINDILGTHTRDVNELRHVLDNIDQPGSRGRIGEAFANREVLGARTGSAPQARFPDVPNATRNPVIADNIRPSGRTLDVKTGYTNTDIDLEQLRNYELLRQESQTAGSAVARQLEDQFGVAGGRLTGTDYLFLPGGTRPDQSARNAAIRALDQIAGANLQAAANVYYVDNIGRVFRLERTAGGLRQTVVPGNTLGL